MTRQEEIADLQARISNQSRNHKTRSGLSHRLVGIRLSQLQEEVMAHHPIDRSNAPWPTPRDEVDFAIYALGADIIDLQKMRMENTTADFILQNSEAISGLARQLDALASDIHLARHKIAAE